VVLAVVVAITVRLVTVQISERDQWVAFGQDQRDGWRELPAGRGAIYDRNGQALAMSVIQPDVVADPNLVPDKAAAAELLAPVLDVEPSRLQERLAVEGDYALLASGVSAEVAAEIDEIRVAEDAR